MNKELFNKTLFFKAIGYRVCAFFVVFMLSFFVTGNGIIAGTISVLELVSKLLIYYLYEIAWKKISKTFKEEKE